MNAPFSISDQATSEILLRVLNGRLEGAEHRLFIGKHIRIGHGFDHDVVLRGAGTKGISIELHLGEDAALIHVKSGQILLLGRPVGIGEEAILPLYVPVRVGDFGFAIGHGEEDSRWAEAERILASAPAILAPQSRAASSDDGVGSLASMPGEIDPHKPRAAWLERLGTRFYAPDAHAQWTRYWPALSVAAAGLLIVAIAAGPIYSWTNTQFKGPEAARATLSSAGYKSLKVTQDKNSGRILIQGILPNDKALGRLRQFATTKLESPIINVKTMDGLAAAATGLLQAENVDAEAKVARNQSLTINSQYLPMDRQNELIAQLKRELPEIRAINFQQNSARGDDALQYFFSVGDNGMATFVDGDPGYINTTKSGKWFAGATLPTGHKLIFIGNGVVRFERDGQLEELLF